MLVPNLSIGRWPLSSDVDCHVSTSKRHLEFFLSICGKKFAIPIMMFLSLHSNLHSLTLLQQALENHTPKLLNSHSLDFPYRTPLILFQPPPRAPPQQQSYLRPPSPRHRRPRPRRHYQRPNSLEPRHSRKFIRSVEEAEAEAPQEGQELLRQQMYEEDHTVTTKSVLNY